MEPEVENTDGGKHEDETTSCEKTNGELPDGETTNGELPDGETTKDENTEGENTEGENTGGETKKTRKTKAKSEPKPKPKFEEICSHCSKCFKNNKLYEKHINEQICYKTNEITYCKLCLIHCNNHNYYKQHLFTLEHINNIGCHSIEKIKQPTTATVHTLDPYLNNNDIAKISTKNLGNSFTFVYEKGHTQTITLQQQQPQLPLPLPLQQVANSDANSDANMSHMNVNIINQSIHNTINNIIQEQIDHNSPIPEPTIRQMKIINFLQLQITKSSIDESGKLFYKMLDNKLQIEDYKGLQNIIKHLDINNDYKSNYLNTVDIFINSLVKENTLGKMYYKDKDISQLVINLTS